MDAQIYQLAAIRSKRNSRMFMEKLSPMPWDSDGSAILFGVMSFWVTYSAAMVSYHQRILSAAFSPYSKYPKEEAKQ